MREAVPASHMPRNHALNCIQFNPGVNLTVARPWQGAML
jgi:hypothetical protein